MIRTLDASMLGLSHPIEVLAPLAAKFGFQAVSVPQPLLRDKSAAREAAAVMAEYGLSWGLMPMPADFYFWDLDDGEFEKSLETLRRDACAARVLGASHAYNHVWSSSPREFHENFQWTVQRIRAVNSILRENDISYGLEFLGPHELRSMAKHPFIHSLAGALALADAADGSVGIAFDVFHWHCSHNSDPDDLLLMEQNIHRLIAVHLSDGVPGRSFDQQQDMDRRLPVETGVIDAKQVLARFQAHPCGALYMAEPFEPWRTRLQNMPAEEAVRTAAQALDRLV